MRWASVLVLALILAGCGLPNIVFLAPPIEVTSIGGVDSRIVLFRHDASANNFDDFLGYELYYKLYTEADPQADLDRENINDNLPPTESGLTGLGFRRFVALDSDTVLANDRPHISTSDFDRGASVVFSIDLREDVLSPTGDITVSWTNGSSVTVTKQLRRNHTNSAILNPADALSFWTQADYSDSHQDYSFGANPTRLEIVVAVLSYGISPSDLSQVFSEPLALDPSVLII